MDDVYKRLCAVVSRYNDNWTPSFTRDERRWYPEFRLYSELALSRMPDEEKREVISTEGFKTEYAAFGYAFSVCSPSGTVPYVCSGLVFKSKELCMECAKTFLRLWMEWCLEPL